MQLQDRTHRYLALILAVLLITFSQLSVARDELPAIDDQYISVDIVDPTRDAGYVVGDILQREITLTVRQPYQLITESLPIVGYEHRYRGKKSGIELVKVNQSIKQGANSETYLIDLSYQVFKTDRVAKPAALRAEVLKLRNTKTKKVVQYKLPDFTFRISPLSLIGQINLDQEMYPFIPPLTLDHQPITFNIKVLAAILALALLGLLYIFGTYTWLPRMGAPFAKAYRDIKKLPNSPEGIQQAITRVHQSLNQTAGGSLFNNNLDQFIAQQSAFLPMQAEIEQFFGLSHEVFFEDASQSLTAENPKTWLLQFCRRMRDCERGLRPDPLQGNA